MPNHLVGQTSPYLLQHAHNPVDWYPWGDEALQRARREQRPIFLSVGYAACHWCHVMEHESFENEELARTLNEHFVCIKVDREERPDIDQLYMQAVQMITGRGGWPMSVFLTPELEPFFGGTYWPPTSRQGMPGFDRVLQAVLEAWRDRRQQAMEQARQLTQRVRQLSDLSASKADRPALTHQLRIAAVADLERVFDHQWGGFGGAPKFPHPMDLRVILRQWRRSPQDAVLQMVTRTLDAMASGGIYDHLGGGFHRYSVDARWLVPHFEKMLYDNALLTMCYVEAWQATGREDYARVARETCEFVLRELTTAEGAFASTLDADSEGEEGKYYVWSLEELQRVLGPDAARTFAYVYDVTATGNFEGHSILNLGKTLTQCAHVLQRDEQELSQELAQSRARLLSARENRVRPGLDDKVLVSWNGLMIEALALAGAALREPRFTDAAARAAETLLTRLRRDDGGLYHTFREGRAHLNAYLDDYAALALGLTTLYEADFQHRWIGEAVRLSERMLRDFSDVGGGALFFTAADHEQLIARPKDIMDSSVPSGNSLAATLLCRLAKLTGRADFSAGAEGIFTAFAHMIEQSPTATGQLLIALDFHLGPTSELVLVGDPRSTDVQQLLADLQRRFVPNRVLSCAAETPPTELAALWNGKLPMEASNLPVPPRLFVCQDFTCQAPIDGKEAILAAWDQLEISGASPTHAGKPATGP